jgi:hypothetical protein
MHPIASFIAVAGALALGACAVPPTGPSVMVLPAQGKNFADFQQDDATCAQFAAAQPGGTPQQAAAQTTINNAILGTVVGAATGAAIGAAVGNPAIGAAVGAGGGLLLGTAAGANASNLSGYDQQRRYDMRYIQCMYSKGNQVPTIQASAAYRPAYGPVVIPMAPAAAMGPIVTPVN